MTSFLFFELSRISRILCFCDEFVVTGNAAQQSIMLMKSGVIKKQNNKEPIHLFCGLLRGIMIS